jgi:teichuronic acid biosynthesis protein TuaF
MNEMFKRVLNRTKKLAVLLLLIPILTAAAGYFFASQKPANYTASSQMFLGNFENQKQTNPTIMKDYVTKTGFLEKVNEKYQLNLNVPQVKSRFTTNANQQGNILELGYRSPDQQEAEETLRKLTEVILAEGTELYENKKDIFANQIRAIKESESEYEKVYKEVELLDKLITEIDLNKPEILEPVTVKNSQVVSPVQTAVLGFLLGVILNFFIILLPELFREEKN